MSEILLSCPICFSDKILEAFQCEDFTVTHEIFKIQQCTSCNFLFTNPRPDQHGIQKYYKSSTYISHTNSRKGFLNTAYQSIRKRTVNNKLVIVEETRVSPRTILDYGCGTGEFLSRAKTAGWIAYGLEPDDDARKLANENHQLNVGNLSDLNSFEQGQFGVITLWHVLEHVHELQSTISQFHKILSASGRLIIAVPNANSYDASYYKSYWAAYDVPRHLYHFTREDMAALMDKNGFKIDSVSALFFDPFYISLLSEKYKNGWMNPINAFITGLKTTVKGRKSIDANSSLLYVIKKK